MKKLSLYFFILLFVAITAPLLGMAQTEVLNGPLPTVQDTPNPCTSPDIYCPIDGGLSLLIAAGIGLGARRAYNRRRLAI